VAQGEVFEDQFGVASTERANQAKDQLEEFDHLGRLAAGSNEALPSPITALEVVMGIRIWFCHPTTILTARSRSSAGYRRCVGLLEFDMLYILPMNVASLKPRAVHYS
jgi:hypothetical protein